MSVLAFVLQLNSASRSSCRFLGHGVLRGSFRGRLPRGTLPCLRNCVLDGAFLWPASSGRRAFPWPASPGNPPRPGSSGLPGLVPRASQAGAKQSNAMQSKATHRKAMQCKVKQRNAKQCNAKQSTAKQCNAKQSNAKHCKAKQRKAVQSKSLQCKAKRSNTKQSIILIHRCVTVPFLCVGPFFS